MAEDVFADSIGYLIARVCKAHRGAVSQELERLGLHVGQEMFLQCLWRQEGLTQSELVQQLGVQPATVSKMLRRIEQSGLVTKCQDAVDHRVSRVHLTPAGRELKEPVDAAWTRTERRVLGNLSTPDIELLRGLLLQVAANLEEDNTL